MGTQVVVIVGAVDFGPFVTDSVPIGFDLERVAVGGVAVALNAGQAVAAFACFASLADLKNRKTILNIGLKLSIQMQRKIGPS